ncbi:hypothetical protein BKA63DRAFT_491433 [Paraphoma chrysanthemicola]|nr:hypothetical protein BKA63DRAFT_491433 [Paraphoma chrysanthemicola]
MLDEEHDPPTSNAYGTNFYTCARVGDHNVVTACLPQAQTGTHSAASCCVDESDAHVYPLRTDGRHRRRRAQQGSRHRTLGLGSQQAAQAKRGFVEYLSKLGSLLDVMREAAGQTSFTTRYNTTRGKRHTGSAAKAS